MVFGLRIGISEEEQTETCAELARLTGTEGSRWRFEWHFTDSLGSKGHWVFTTRNPKNQAYSKLMQAGITPEKTEANGIITLTISHRDISTYLAEKKEREEREEAAAKEKASTPTPRSQSPTPTGGLTREALATQVGIVRAPYPPLQPSPTTSGAPPGSQAQQPMLKQQILAKLSEWSGVPVTNDLQTRHGCYWNPTEKFFYIVGSAQQIATAAEKLGEKGLLSLTTTQGDRTCLSVSITRENAASLLPTPTTASPPSSTTPATTVTSVSPQPIAISRYASGTLESSCANGIIGALEALTRNHEKSGETWKYENRQFTLALHRDSFTRGCAILGIIQQTGIPYTQKQHNTLISINVAESEAINWLTRTERIAPTTTQPTPGR